MDESGPGGNPHRGGAMVEATGKPVLVTHWLGYPTHCDSWHSIWKITVLENWAGLSLIYVEINTNKK